MQTVGQNTTIDELLVQCDYHPMRDDPVFKLLVTLAEGAAKVHPNDRITVFDDLVNTYDEDISDLKSEIAFLSEELETEQYNRSELAVEVKALRMHCQDNLKDVLYRADLRGLQAELHDVASQLESIKVKYRIEQQEHKTLKDTHQTLVEKYNTWQVISG